MNTTACRYTSLFRQSMMSEELFCAGGEAFETLLNCISGVRGQCCFEKIAEGLCRLFGADIALVGEIVAGNHLKFLSLRRDGTAGEEESLLLEKTIFATLTTHHFIFLEDEAVERFPEDPFLGRWGVRGFLGVPIRSHDGIVAGVVCCMFCRPVNPFPFGREVLSLMAEKAGWEIECLLDGTMRRMNEEYFGYLCRTDPLTGLPNRIQFRDRFSDVLAAKAASGAKAALLLLDLDRFKNINDSLGHETGDRVICLAAERLRDHVGELGMAAKFWGDEFTIFLDQIASNADVLRFVTDLRECLAKPYLVDESALYVTASIGISLFPDDGSLPQSLIDSADAALSCAKKEGKDTYRFYSSEMNRQAKKLLVLENYLRTAIENGQLRLQYQPQVDMHSGRLVGFEALLRWEHPEQSLISPADFIPLAEETGLIISIGEWVLETACAQNRAWQDLGLPPVPVSVNISAPQFRNPALLEIVPRVLKKNGLDPRWLELEITEGGVLGDAEMAIDIMEHLTGMGVSLAIDDFGTGYSSLNYLKRFPIRTLKIDKSFIQDVTENADSAVIASAIIALARSMNLNVIAEGVETADQSRFLLEKGCSLAQGYLFGKPMNASDVPRLFRASAGEEDPLRL